MEMEKLETVYSLLNEKWYFGKDIEDLSVTLMEKAIAGMASSDLDIHTTYMSLEDAQTFSSSLEGTFIGVGLQFYQNSRGEYIVADVFEIHRHKKRESSVKTVLYRLKDLYVMN